MLEGCRQLIGLPMLVRIGLLVLVAGGLADIAAHIEAGGHAGQLHEHTAAEVSAHVVAFAGMVLIQFGVVVDGVRRTSARRIPAGRSQGVV